MNNRLRRCCTVALLALSAAALQSGRAQDVADPLTIQGLDQFGHMSARSRAMGGSAVAAGSDVSAMFVNPATLLRLDRPEIRAGGYSQWYQYEQTQEWVPNRFYAGLSLMCEDIIDGIKDVEPLPPNPADRVQRPYDDIGPNWYETTNTTGPSLAALGVPFALGDIRIAAGIGYTQVANLQSYFQNNNALAPNIGAFRPAPLPVVTGTDSMKVQWYQFIRKRTGTINGVTPALAVEVLKGLSVGASATILFGSSDDVEQRVERGLLTFFYDKFRSDSLYDRTTRTGTSSYSGVIPALGGVLRQEAFTLGVSVRLPMTLTREWDRTVVRDTAGTVTTTTEAGTDKLELPVAVSLGGVLHPSPDVDVALDYRIGNNGNVTYTPSGGSSLQPWLSSQELRAGVEFRATTWLALRGGFRQVSAPFAGAGAPLLDEPESGQAYSAGVGLGLADLRFDLAYEYASLKYEDAWQSNVNYNTRQTNTIWFETAYRF